MDLREIFEKRKSIRKFTGELITEDQIKLIMEAAQIAPSASNKQPYKFIVIKDDELKTAFRKKTARQNFIEKAAVIFVVLGIKEREYWYKVDIGIAVEHMALQAAELGLGSCWIGAIEREKVRELLKIPNDWEIVSLLIVGIPDQDPPARPRKSLDELFVNDSFQ
jgi:nitroreductase